MHILLICPYPLNTVPGQRLKYEQYLDYLRSKGYKITLYPFFSQKAYKILYLKGMSIAKSWEILLGFLRRIFLLFLIPSADGIYVFLNVVPLGPPLLEWLYLKLAKRTIYDIDDMVHLLRTSNVNRLSQRFKTRDRYFLIMKEADHVITCTPTLDNIVREHNKNTTDISSTINTKYYVPVNSYTNKRKLVIGWSGSHSTVPYLHLIDAALQHLASCFDFKLLVMGTNNFSIPGVEVEVIPWSVGAEIPTLQQMDIGVYPLPNDNWVLGKSGLKALQYMALGLPTVATAIGCNDRVIEEGISGYLVSSDNDWISRLGQLLENPALRRRIGENARRRVECYYSVEVNKDRYLSIFQSIYGFQR